MKYLKTYENFKSPDDWQIGDIVVSLITTYWVKKDTPYEIIDIDTPWSLEDEITIKIKDIQTGQKMIDYYPKSMFITLEEYEINKNIDKYNL